MNDQSARMAPVQGFAAGIPWSLHLRAYDAYCKLYGRQQSLIEGNCRGGFGVSELDTFIPGWRDEVSEIRGLRDEIDRLRAALAVFADCDSWNSDCVWDRDAIRDPIDFARRELEGS